MKNFTFTGVTHQEWEDALVCWICENDFSDNDQVVLDQCHYTDKFLGWAHNECIINEEKFILMENYFEKLGHSPEKVIMLKEKGHYPYSYFNSIEKFRETRLAPRAI